MPHSESTQATFAIIWIMAMGLVFCAVLKSPWGFAFLFGLVWCFASVLKDLTSSSSRNDVLHQSDDNDNNHSKDTEMQPLGKIRGDMTLGEILARY
jgi:hypothetical protein